MLKQYSTHMERRGLRPLHFSLRSDVQTPNGAEGASPPTLFPSVNTLVHSYVAQLEKTGNLQKSLLINYPLEAKIQKFDNVTACAFVPNAYVPNFSLVTQTQAKILPKQTSSPEPPLLLQRKPSIRRSSLRALTSLSQLRCDNKVKENKGIREKKL